MFKKSKIEFNGITITQEEILEMSNHPEKFKDEVYIANGDLDFTGCTSLTSLPDGLQVGGYLNLYGCTNLTSLPDGLKVNGSLNLEGCTSLTSLPGGLQVGGDLYVRGSFLKTKTKNEIKEMIYPGLKGKIYGGKK